jgi:CRP-like cAMP-binding protein
MVTALAGVLDLDAYAMHRPAAGQMLSRAGALAKQLPLVVAGSIDAVLHVGSQGNLVIPISFESGELAMVSTLFSDKPGHADLVAGPGVALRWIPVPDIERCLLQHRELLVLLVRFLAQRLREVQSRERGWLERGVPERVCVAIARAMHNVPAREDGRHWLETTHEHLAARSGVSRPKLSMELKRLEKDGHLRLHRGAIEILRPEKFDAQG